MIPCRMLSSSPSHTRWFSYHNWDVWVSPEASWHIKAKECLAIILTIRQICSPQYSTCRVHSENIVAVASISRRGVACKRLNTLAVQLHYLPVHFPPVVVQGQLYSRPSEYLGGYPLQRPCNCFCQSG